MREQKDNSGAVFANDRKEQDSHPDRTGSARVGGVDYYVNAWLNKTSEGKPYLSLKFKEKEQKPLSQHNAAKANAYQPDSPSYANAAAHQRPVDMEEDSIPF